MSWQAYVDTNLIASGSVTAAGIYDLQGNPWAYSAGFAAQIAEVAAVSGHMHTGDPSGLAGTGVRAAALAPPLPTPTGALPSRLPRRPHPSVPGPHALTSAPPTPD